MNYTVIYSNRKTICAEILRDGSIVVRAPKFCPEALLLSFLKKNEELILKKQVQIRSLPPIPEISPAEAKRLRQKTKDIVMRRVRFYAEAHGFSYQGIKITSARYRFGSCSAKKNLCFSLFLGLCTPEEIDYVVLHELCHTVEMNHSARFYSLLGALMPDYRERERSLKKRQFPIIKK